MYNYLLLFCIVCINILILIRYLRIVFWSYVYAQSVFQVPLSILRHGEVSRLQFDGFGARLVAAGHYGLPRRYLPKANTRLYWCAGHGTILTGESPATGIYRQV